MSNFKDAYAFLDNLEHNDRNSFLQDDKYYPIKKLFLAELRAVIKKPKQLTKIINLFNQKDRSDLILDHEFYWQQTGRNKSSAQVTATPANTPASSPLSFSFFNGTEGADSSNQDLKLIVNRP
jgi:hypothetical protein